MLPLRYSFWGSSSLRVPPPQRTVTVHVHTTGTVRIHNSVFAIGTIEIVPASTFQPVRTLATVKIVISMATLQLVVILLPI